MNDELLHLLEVDERDPRSIVVVTDALLYVGISRAISQLVLIGPEALAARVGLGP